MAGAFYEPIMLFELEFYELTILFLSPWVGGIFDSFPIATWMPWLVQFASKIVSRLVSLHFIPFLLCIFQQVSRGTGTGVLGHRNVEYTLACVEFFGSLWAWPFLAGSSCPFAGRTKYFAILWMVPTVVFGPGSWEGYSEWNSSGIFDIRLMMTGWKAVYVITFF